jgi:hypothetical protein
MDLKRGQVAWRRETKVLKMLESQDSLPFVGRASQWAFNASRLQLAKIVDAISWKASFTQPISSFFKRPYSSVLV